MEFLTSRLRIGREENGKQTINCILTSCYNVMRKRVSFTQSRRPVKYAYGECDNSADHPREKLRLKYSLGTNNSPNSRPIFIRLYVCVFVKKSTFFPLQNRHRICQRDSYETHDCIHCIYSKFSFFCFLFFCR